jgi:hypothetical protein
MLRPSGSARRRQSRLLPLMKTLAVMCIAFTRQSPSATPDSRTAASTWPVMLTNSIRSAVCIFK